jgi:hypothetical protein
VVVGDGSDDVVTHSGHVVGGTPVLEVVDG